MLIVKSEKNLIYFFPIRLFIDLFFMITNTINRKYSYCVSDPSSYIRTLIYLLVSKIFIRNCKFYIDIRGGGPRVRLEKKSSKISNIQLFLIYYLADKVILQTSSFGKVSFQFKDKMHFLPNTLNNFEKSEYYNKISNNLNRNLISTQS